MHNFKKVLKTFLVLVVCVALLAALDLALYPCTFMRNDVHAVVTQQFDDIIVGTSHGKMDIDPEVMQEVTGRSGHNLCVGGEYGIDAYYLTKLIKEKQNPKRIIYEVDPGYFVSEKEEGNNYLLFYHEFPFSKAKVEYFWNSIAKCNFRTVLFPWYEYSLSYEIPKIKETFLQKVKKDYSIDGLKSARCAAGFHGYARVCRTKTVCYAMSNARLKKFGLLSAEEYLCKARCQVN